MSILIFSAVFEELACIHAQIKNPIVQKIGGRTVTKGLFENIPVRILITGPGMANTVQGLTAFIEHKRPQILIQTGCAGAFKNSGLNIGDIGLATQENDAHLGLESPSGIEPLPFSVLPNISHSYPINNTQVKKAFDILKANFKYYVKKGPFVTVSTITTTDARADFLYKRFGACMESMEGAGAAHVAIHYNLPFLEIRGASNFVGKRDRENWNLSLAFERSNLAAAQIIKKIQFL